MIRVVAVYPSLSAIPISNSIIMINHVGVMVEDEKRKLSEYGSIYQPVRVEVVGKLSRRALADRKTQMILDKATITMTGARVGSLRWMWWQVEKAAEAISAKFANTMSNSLPAGQAQLLTGLLLGGRGRLSGPLRDQVREAGLAHLVAASGYNVSLITDRIATVVSLLGKSIITIPIVIIITSLYAVIAGGGAAVIRAAVMGLVIFLTRTLGGCLQASRRVFVATVLGMIMIWPAWVNDLGFQLSAVATAAMIWLQPQVWRRLGRFAPDNLKHWLGWARWPKLGVSESLAAALASGPVLAWRLGWDRYSYVAPITNIPATLLVTPLVAYGLIVSLAGMMHPAGGLMVAVLGNPLVATLVWVIEAGAGINQSLKQMFL